MAMLPLVMLSGGKARFQWGALTYCGPLTP